MATQRPIYPNAPREYSNAVFTQLINSLRLRDRATPVAPASVGWTTDNVTPTRDLDVSTATTADIANVLATLIEDLKAVGYLG